MKEFLQLMRRFVSPYKKYIGWAILLNILSAVFNVFSFTLLIPILDILFKGSDITYSINGKQIVLSKSRSNASSKVDKRLLTGTVIDSKGEAVIGANVIVKGEKSGKATDIEGNFSIEVPDKGVLLVSYIGFQPQEVSYGTKKNVTVVLQENNTSLDEVVVVGFGKQKKESVIGAIQSVKASELRVPTTNLTNTFAGRMPA